MNSLVVKRLSSIIDDILFSNMLFHGFEVGISIFFKLREEWRYFVFCRRPRYQDQGLGGCLALKVPLTSLRIREIFLVVQNSIHCVDFLPGNILPVALYYLRYLNTVLCFSNLLSFMDPRKDVILFSCQISCSCLTRYRINLDAATYVYEHMGHCWQCERTHHLS